MDLSTKDRILALRQTLHAAAELSGREQTTKAILMRFLSENTSLQLFDQGKWFYALHSEGESLPNLAFRADMDALPNAAGGASHLCGHDGHCAALAGLGLVLEGRTLGKNLYFLFQHAEETGQGGPECRRLIREKEIAEIYAFHNIPGWPEGSVLLRHGTFACASKGMTVRLVGQPSHAAYPEAGKNPGFAAAALISQLPSLLSPEPYGGMVLATLVGAEIGAPAFGTAAGTAEVWLTLRAWREADLQTLQARIEETARSAAQRDGLEVSFSFCDEFPETANEEACLEKLIGACASLGIPMLEPPEPFRWSEDFGHYLKDTRGAMFGIGIGTGCPQLHTAEYRFNDRILPTAIGVFEALATR